MVGVPGLRDEPPIEEGDPEPGLWGVEGRSEALGTATRREEEDGTASPPPLVPEDDVCADSAR